MSKITIDAESLKCLDFTKKESKIFLALLKSGAMTATDIARIIEMPRTSALLVLEGLKTKGCVERIKVGGHFEWEAVELDTLETLVSERFGQFQNTIPLLRDLVRTQSLEKKFSVKVFSGASGMLRAYYRLLDLPKGERILFFEGLESVKLKMSMRDQSIIKWQNAFRNSGIIIEAFGSRKAFNEVKQRKGINVLKAHQNRLLVTYELPDAIANVSCDIAVLPNTVLLFIPKTEHAVVIDSNDLAQTLRQMFIGLRMISNKIDANKEVNTLLQE